MCRQIRTTAIGNWQRNNATTQQHNDTTQHQQTIKTKFYEQDESRANRLIQEKRTSNFTKPVTSDDRSSSVDVVLLCNDGFFAHCLLCRTNTFGGGNNDGGRIVVCGGYRLFHVFFGP